MQTKNEIENALNAYTTAFKKFKKRAKKAEGKEKEVLELSITVSQDSATTEIKNIVLDEFMRNPEKWTGIKTNSEEFKKLFCSTFGTQIVFKNDKYNGFKIFFKCFEAPYNTITILYNAYPEITKEKIKALKKLFYKTPIPPEAIEKRAGEAIEAKKEFIEKYEATQKDLEAIRGKYKDSFVLFNIFPVLPNIEN